MKHLKKIALQKAVMDVMEKNLNKWQDTAALVKKYNQFVRNLKKIEDHEANLQIDLSPLKKKKTESKSELVDKVFPVTGVLEVYASDTGDKKLIKLARIDSDELRRMDHGALVTYCIKVVKVSRVLLGEEGQEGRKTPRYVVADYGLSPGHLDSLQEALDSCLSDEAAYARMRSRKKKSKKRIKRRIRENNTILKDQLDRMVHLFRETQPSFYSSYIKARIPETAGETPEEKATAAEKAVPAETITVTGTKPPA